jgi:uncharacterized protein HemX
MSQPDTVEDNDAQAAADDTDVTVDAEIPAPGTHKPTRRRGLYLVSGLALICAFLAAAAAGVLWWQYRMFYADLDQTDLDTGYALQAVRADLSALEDRLADVAAVIDATRGAAADLDVRVDAIPGRFLDLEERINATQGVSEDARRRWLREEAEYYLTVANAEITLAGDWDSAATALQLADQKILELANPAFSVVRERIAAELMALRAVRLPDVEGLSYSLGRLSESGRTLPMRMGLPGNYATGAAAPTEVPSGFARVWLSLKNAIAGMVSIERREEVVARSLSADQQALLRQQLELELVLARLALVRGQSEVFRGSIESARTLLDRHFDPMAVSVESAIALLDEMVGLEIAPPRPDISGSLSLLRGIADRDR